MYVCICIFRDCVQLFWRVITASGEAPMFIVMKKDAVMWLVTCFSVAGFVTQEETCMLLNVDTTDIPSQGGGI